MEKASKYFANVEKITNSLKTMCNEVTTNSHLNDNESVLYNQINILSTIISNQNELLQYILSYDKSLNINSEPDDFCIAQTVYVISINSWGVIKEVLEDELEVKLFKNNTTVKVSKKDIKK